jgi:chemotaxis protein methyltransferase CheR
MNMAFSPSSPLPRPERDTSASASKTLVSKPTAIPQPVREFEFTTGDFERIRKLLYDNAGIVLSPAKQDMVYSRLARRLRACGDKTFFQYLQRLERNSGEWEIFINSLTTNLTSFFRESHHFDILAEQMKQMKERRPFKIWCCAASTGEEPYSLAITACEAFSTLAPPVEIIASDIDTAVLAQGEKGIYRRDRLERMQPAMLARYFMPYATIDDSCTVRAELRRLISFRRINLLSPAWSVQGPLDAIFCRNVMIYFDKPTQYGILKRFVPLMRPEGRLYAGHSESFMHAGDLLRSLGRTVYVRLDSPLH